MAGEEFMVASGGIEDGGRLARKYTQEGQGAKKNISPPLEWYNIPEGTVSIALVVEDPTVIPSTYWVLANIPPSLKGLPEGFSGADHHASPQLSLIQEGINDLKVPGWCGPVPSNGSVLEFKLYALDVEVNLGKKVTKEKLLEDIEGHVLGEAVLTAVY